MYWFGSPFPSEADTADHPQTLPWSTDLAGRNLATCIWQSRADAVAAMRGERHKRAAQLASVSRPLRFLGLTRGIDEAVSSSLQRSYESYTLERYVLRKEAGELTVRVAPWHGGEVAGASVAAVPL